jgi:hypothetical protein
MGHFLSIPALALALLPAHGFQAAGAVPDSRQKEESRAAAERILEGMQEAYSTCSSYRDEGQVETVFISLDGKREDLTRIRPFATAFVRESGQFRFEFRDRFPAEAEWKTYVVWRERGVVKSWWTIKPEVREWEDISRGLAAATGVSGSSASRVPSLLMNLSSRPEPPPQANFIGRLSEARVVGRETVEGVPCTRIDALERKGRDSCSLWVDDDHLIRKWYSISELAANEPRPTIVTTTITWKPVINEEIPASALTFEPPHED